MKSKLYSIRWIFCCFFLDSFRRGAPPRHEGRAPPRGRDSFPGPEDFGPEENFDPSDEAARGRDLRGRGRGTPRGERVLGSLSLARTGWRVRLLGTHLKQSVSVVLCCSVV